MVAKLKELIRELKGRIPEEQLIEFIVSFAYYYCNSRNLISGINIELLSVAQDNSKRMPDTLFQELKAIFSELDLESIKSILYDLLFVKRQFDDNSNQEIVKLAYNLLDIKNGDKIFDLGCGTGTLLAGVYK